MRQTSLFLVLSVSNLAALFYFTNGTLTVFGSNESIFNSPNNSDSTIAKNTFLSNPGCTNFHSLSCRLPSCDIKPTQQGCPLHGPKFNSTAFDILLHRQKH